MSHDDKAPSNPSREWGAKGEVTTLIVAGLLLAIVGAVIAYAAWPSQELADSVFGDGGLEETGSEVWALVGSLVALVGQTMAAIGVIAAGVRLGNRA